MDGVSYKERIVNAIVRGILHLICRLDIQGLEKLPRKGPGFILSNHTTNIEGPAVYVFIQPRPATALAKRELWKHWYTRFFMKTWGVVPVHRGRVDRTALRAAVRALDSGKYLGIAPEGTRSKTGRLKHAQPGVALLATMRPAPIYPVAHWGLLDLGHNLKRLRRTPVSFRVGRPFVVHVDEGRKLSSGDLRAITDEMMRELARVLPEELRGAYAETVDEPPRFLEYLDE